MAAIVRYSKEQIATIEGKVSKFIIPDPNDELIEIYETDKLINLMNIRVEKYDSPEFQTELQELKEKWVKENTDPKKEFKVPRHIQNPNYNQVLKFLKELRNPTATPDQKAETLKGFLLFVQNFVTLPLDYKQSFLNYLPDIRLIDDLETYFNYLNTRYLITEELRDFIINVVYTCFPIQMKYFQSESLEIELKDDESPLTMADQETSNFICDKLKQLTPNIPILCEETDDMPYKERREHDFIWIVDPLDGTKEFIKGLPDFTVNIGLAYQGVPIFGVVGIPYHNQIYYGNIGKGSYKLLFNEDADPKPQSIQVTPLTPETTIAKVVASRSHINKETQEYIDTHYPDAQVLSAGSSIKLLYVAEGKAHAYPRLGPTNEWDVCVTHAVVLAAGGTVTNARTNQELEYNKENVLNPYFICTSL